MGKIIKVVEVIPTANRFKRIKAALVIQLANELRESKLLRLLWQKMSSGKMIQSNLHGENE